MLGFVADEHIPLATINILRAAGYRVLSVREECPGANDEQILQLADCERLVIITCDKDFGELIYKEKAKFSSGVVYCCSSKFSPNEIAELILYHLNEFTAEFEGMITVLSRGKFRQRHL